MNCKPQKDNKLKFTTDVLWVGISQVMIYILSFLTLPALTKNYGAETYGLWAQIVVTVGLAIPILTFQLNTATVRYLSNKDSMIGQSFSNMLWIIILGLILTIFIATIFRTELSILLFKNSIYSIFIVLTFIWAGTGTIFALLLSYLRAKGEIGKISIINFLIYFFKYIPIIILACAGISFLLVIMTQIVVELLFIILLFLSIRKEIGLKLPNTTNLKKYLSFSIPQIPSAALLWIIDSSDRYFITNYLGLSQTGIYSASYGIGSLISLFYIPLSFVVFPLISSLWEEGEISSVRKYLEYSTKIFLFLGIPGTIGLYILSKPILQIITTPEFLVGGGLLTFLIALSTIFLGIYQINLYIICLIEKTKFIPIIVGLSAISNIILNIILIQKVGIIGAAVSTIISYMILSMIVLIWAKKRINYHIEYKFLFKIILSSLLMYSILTLLPQRGFIDIFLTTITGLIIYLIFTVLFRTFSKKDMKRAYTIFSTFIEKIR